MCLIFCFSEELQNIRLNYLSRTVFTIGALAVFQGIVLVGCKSVVGYIFTSDE